MISHLLSSTEASVSYLPKPSAKDPPEQAPIALNKLGYMPSINSAQVSLLPELLLQALGYSDAQVPSSGPQTPTDSSDHTAGVCHPNTTL